MVDLEQMVVGVNHEINHPISFISSNLTVCEYIQKLLNIISAYQKEYPNPTLVVKQVLEEVDPDLLPSHLKNTSDAAGEQGSS